MNTHHLRRLFQKLLLLVGLLGCLELAYARGETGDESALAVFQSRAAPLALSANGQWRVHVDAKNVLHRVNLADAKQKQQVELPDTVLQLAASRTAQKVAFVSPAGCVGVVDFGNPLAPTPKITKFDTKSEASGRFNCDSPWEHPLVAISTDGKLLATVSQVFDVESGAAVADLPSSAADIGHRRTVNIQFTDNNTKLFLTTATLGEGYESADSPSDMQFSLWDLRSKKLWNLAGGTRPTQFVQEMFVANYSLQTGALHFVNSDRYFLSRSQQGANSESEPLLDLMQSNLHTCQAKTSMRLALTPWQWSAYAFDPWGRWIAGIRKLESTPTQGVGRRGRNYVEELQIISLATGKTVETIPLLEPLHALVVAPDGASIFGITPFSMVVDPLLRYEVRKTTGSDLGGEVVQIKLHPDALSASKMDSVPFSASPCTIENETPSARVIEKTGRRLKPLWTELALVPYTLVSESEKIAPTNSPTPPPDTAPVACNSAPASMSFTRADQTLWVDQYQEINQLDWTTGKVLKTLVPRRKSSVCSASLPQADGLINYQGDTISFQTFDSLAASTGKKQIIEVKPGWYVESLTWITVAGQTTRTFEVTWRAKPGTTPSKNAEGQSLDIVLSTYDMATKRRIREFAMLSEAYYMGSFEVPSPSAASNVLDCKSQSNLGKTVAHLEDSHFGSFRVQQCAGADRIETVFWADLNIEPRTLAQTTPKWGEYTPSGQLLGFTGSIAVVQDRFGMVRVFDVLARRELAQILPEVPLNRLLRAHVSEAKGVVVLETLRDGEIHDLRAYAFR